MQNLYRKIFFTTTKYIILRNFFMCITGLLSILIVRLLGPSEYGKYSLVWQLISTIGPIVSLGWQATLAKFAPEKTDEEKKSLFTQSFLSVLVASIIFFIIGFFIIQLFPKIVPLEIKDLKFVFLIFITLVAFFNVFEGFYRGLGKFNEWTVIDGLRSNLGNILGIILLIVGHRYYKPIILSNFLFSCFFFFLIFSYLFKWIIIDSKMLNLRIEKEIQNFVLTMFVGQIVLLFGTTIDSVLLRALLKDPTQVGFYNAGIRIPKVIELMLIAPLPTPFLYYFSHPELEQNKEKILEFGSRLLGVIFGFCGIFLFSFSREIILFLFGSNYNESIMVLRIFSLILYILGFNVLVSPYFQSINKPQIPLIAGIISFVVFFVGDIFLIPKFKSIAPAISVLIGLFIQTMFILYFLSRLNVKYFVNFILLSFSMLISIIIGFYINFYISFIIFLICVIFTQLFTFSDIKRWREITATKSR